MNETEAIFKIVIRNLSLHEWADLEPEAQVRMIEEAASLLCSHRLAVDNKQQLRKGLELLQARTSEFPKNRIAQILNSNNFV